MSPRRHAPGAALVLPAVLLLALVFVAPLAWFFVEALVAKGGPAEIAAFAASVVGSKAVVTALVTTFWISLLVTLLVLLISYPLAFFMAERRGLAFTAVLFCVIVPYFTSIIVRTYSWMVLLGRNGIVNQSLQALGIVDEPLALLYTKTGVLIGMVYVLLPYMVLTLYATMKAIDPSLMRAARGMGAGALYAFRRIYFPLSLHGVLSGSLIVFILAIGFFITPALMGGPTDVMIAMLIEREVEFTLNWSFASALAVILLALTLIGFAGYNRVVRLERIFESRT